MLSCTLQYVTCPNKITAISFFLLFAKEGKRKKYNFQYWLRRTTKEKNNEIISKIYHLNVCDYHAGFYMEVRARGNI
jgi:hypothetical protein